MKMVRNLDEEGIIATTSTKTRELELGLDSRLVHAMKVDELKVNR